MVHATLTKFGYPGSVVKEYEHWVVLVRPAQVTAASLVLAARDDANAFGALPAEAHAELAVVTRETEAALRHAVHYDRLNYLMLMMVDPHVHFHVLPRYEGVREVAGIEFADQNWPGPPDLSAATKLDRPKIEALASHLRSLYP